MAFVDDLTRAFDQPLGPTARAVHDLAGFPTGPAAWDVLRGATLVLQMPIDLEADAHPAVASAVTSRLANSVAADVGGAAADAAAALARRAAAPDSDAAPPAPPPAPDPELDWPEKFKAAVRHLGAPSVAALRALALAASRLPPEEARRAFAHVRGVYCGFDKYTKADVVTNEVRSRAEAAARSAAGSVGAGLADVLARVTRACRTQLERGVNDATDPVLTPADFSDVRVSEVGGRLVCIGLRQPAPRPDHPLRDVAPVVAGPLSFHLLALPGGPQDQRRLFRRSTAVRLTADELARRAAEAADKARDERERAAALERAAASSPAGMLRRFTQLEADVAALRALVAGLGLPARSARKKEVAS